jgi:hypothetical protein
MNFDKRFNHAMEYLLFFNARPPAEGTRVVQPGVDVEARETILALQAQIEALQRGMATIHGWLIAPGGGNMKGSELDKMLTDATDIKPVEFPQAVLHMASKPHSSRTTRNEDHEDDGDGMPRLSKIKPRKPTSAAGQQPAHSSGRKQRGPKLEQPATLNQWFRKLMDSTGVILDFDRVLYRHARFEQPKIILLPDSDEDHQKLIEWTHSHASDYAVQYGTEEGSQQHWISIPVAALSELGLAVPNDGDGLSKG